jgi:hypothetical protein
MALVKYINYYTDDDGCIRRIPWDTWMRNGAFVGVSPVGIKNQNTIEIDSDGVVTCDTDFLDIANEDDAGKRTSEVTLLQSHTNEREFCNNYDNVFYYYEFDNHQTTELDYDKPGFKE